MRCTPRFASIPLALTLLCFGRAATLAADHHVATTGNDANATGDGSAPWRTINAALQAAQPGDTIILHNGTYRESVRIRRPNITIKSAENEWATIQAGFGTGDSPELCVMFDVDAHGGTLQRLELVGGYYCLFLQTRFDWGEANRAGVSNILVEDCKLHDSGRDCIKVTPKCDRLTIRRCEIYNSGQMYPPGTPFDNKNAEGIDVTTGDRVLVQDCYIHDTATTGLYFKGGAADCVVERTRVSRCGQAGVLLGFDTSPEFFDLTVNPEYYECVRGVVRNCIIEETNYAGIGFYAARDSMAVNNTVINTARVGHSPIYFGITFQDWEPEAGRPASTNVRIVNNVIAQLEPIAQPTLFIRHSEELGGLSGLAGMPEMSNNLYFVAGGAPRFGDSRPATPLTDADLPTWQMHITGDADSFVADPLLDKDGRLTATSPAIDRGVTVEGLADDFDRGARGAKLDIGADEFNADGPSDLPADDPADDDPEDDPTPGGSSTDDSTNGDPRGAETNGASTDDGTPSFEDGRTGGRPGDASDAAAGPASPGEDLENLTGGLCPAAAVGTLSLSLIGMRRTASRRTTTRRRTD